MQGSDSPSSVLTLCSVWISARRQVTEDNTYDKGRAGQQHYSVLNDSTSGVPTITVDVVISIILPNFIINLWTAKNARDEGHSVHSFSQFICSLRFNISLAISFSDDKASTRVGNGVPLSVLWVRLVLVGSAVEGSCQPGDFGGSHQMVCEPVRFGESSPVHIN